jgi:23S rRNA (cytosine1962-C5)-methyltransferase
MVPCVIFEDEHLLVVNKPAGWNTHAPGPYAGEGIYDWLRHREPRWASLAILHRLDKETSGVLVFGKTPAANRSLTDQFTRRRVRKQYLLLTDRSGPAGELTVKTALVRAGDKYLSRPPHPGAEIAETRFRHLAGNRFAAEPLTGRTHQIRVHAADSGFPILGDTLYGGTPAARVCLHAAEITFTHPATGQPVTFQAPVDFVMDLECADMSALLNGRTCPPVEERRSSEPLAHLESLNREPSGHGNRHINVSLRPILPLPEGEGRPARRSLSGGGGEGEREQPASCQPPPVKIPGTATAPHLPLRAAIMDPPATDAFRLIHGAGDGRPGWYVERLGDYLLSQAATPLNTARLEELARLARQFSSTGVYHKLLSRQVRSTAPAGAAPQLVSGAAAPERFTIRENGVRFELGFQEGYSTGLFLDQRDNRRRLLTGHIAAEFPLRPTAAAPWTLLNVFAYTCAFSVCAARAGAHTTSLDLSKKYLDWGRRNFTLNALDPAAHDFIYGDAFDWLRRLAKRGRAFDVVVLDPPTFSQSKEHGAFRAEKDYDRLVTAALPLLRPGGVLLASTNAAGWPPEEFLAVVTAAVRSAGRKILQHHYVPQPPDFPVTRSEPAYLKTVWLRV